MKIGRCENYYGGLWIRKIKGKCSWCIEDYTGFDWQEIPEYLHDALYKYQEELESGMYHD